jgi:hypothetical protein
MQLFDKSVKTMPKTVLRFGESSPRKPIVDVD